MATQIVLLFLIIALVVYSVYLQVQLTRKNIFIEATVKRLSGIEKSRSMDEMMAFLEEIQKLSPYRSYFTSNILEKDTTEFLFENFAEMKSYMHYTKEEADAKNILADGFRFVDSFYKTALPVTRDNLDLKIKHDSRKFFGDYLIIICISNDIVNYYSMEMEKYHIKNHTFENILTELPATRNENSDITYQLSNKFIKGYVNHKTGEIVKNPEFDPWYNSPAFAKNLEALKS
jgi:oligoribonuclease (3'-5' exoribonuclease)